MRSMVNLSCARYYDLENLVACLLYIVVGGGNLVSASYLELEYSFDKVKPVSLPSLYYNSFSILETNESEVINSLFSV